MWRKDWINWHGRGEYTGPREKTDETRKERSRTVASHVFCGRYFSEPRRRSRTRKAVDSALRGGRSKCGEIPEFSGCQDCFRSGIQVPGWAAFAPVEVEE